LPFTGLFRDKLGSGNEENMEKIRVAIADDHAILRAGIKSLLHAQDDMELVGEATDGLEVVKIAGDTQPDVVVLDLTMPRCTGMEAIIEVRTVSPNSRILVLTMHDDHAYLRSVLAKGGAGYLVKRAADTELLAAIRAIFQGRSYIDVGLDNNQLKSVFDENQEQPRSPAIRSFEALSDRERQVLELVALGYTHKEVGETLSVSVKTVETYRSRLSEKLGLRSRAELVRFALELGLLDSTKLSPIGK